MSNNKGRTITGNCGTPPIHKSPNARRRTKSSSISVVQPAIIGGTISQPEYRGRKRLDGSLRNCINQLAVTQQIRRVARQGAAMAQGVDEANAGEVRRE